MRFRSVAPEMSAGMAARARRRWLLHGARALWHRALLHTGEQPVAAAGDGGGAARRSHSARVSGTANTHGTPRVFFMFYGANDHKSMEAHFRQNNIKIK